MTARGVKFSVSTEMVVEECCNCNMAFAMTEEFRKECLEQRGSKTFYCPSGHPQSYSGEKEADKLRRERDRLKQQLAQKDDEILAAVRLQGEAEKATAKLQKRIHNGICPCCTRSFQNLRRHIATKHPDYNVVPLKAEVA